MTAELAEMDSVEKLNDEWGQRSTLHGDFLRCLGRSIPRDRRTIARLHNPQDLLHVEDLSQHRNSRFRAIRYSMDPDILKNAGSPHQERQKRHDASIDPIALAEQTRRNVEIRRRNAAILFGDNGVVKGLAIRLEREGFMVLNF